MNVALASSGFVGHQPLQKTDRGAKISPRPFLHSLPTPSVDELVPPILELFGVAKEPQGAKGDKGTQSIGVDIESLSFEKSGVKAPKGEKGENIDSSEYIKRMLLNSNKNPFNDDYFSDIKDILSNTKFKPSMRVGHFAANYSNGIPEILYNPVNVFAYSHPGYTASAVGHELVHLKDFITGKAKLVFQGDIEGEMKYLYPSEVRAYQYQLDTLQEYGLSPTGQTWKHANGGVSVFSEAIKNNTKVKSGYGY